MPQESPHSAPVEHLNSEAFTKLNLPFSEIVRVGDLLLLSGQIGNLPGSLMLAPGGLQAQARQALLNIEATLKSHGYSLKNVVKCTVMLADMNDWVDFNAVYTTFFERPYPARNAFGASGLALGARLEIDVVATARL